MSRILLGVVVAYWCRVVVAPWPCAGFGATYDFSSCSSPKFKIMHFQKRDIKLYTVVMLFLCFLKFLTKLCCRWSWSRILTVNDCRVREFQIPDRRAQEKMAK